MREASVFAIVCFNPANVCYLSNGFIATITSRPVVAILTQDGTRPALLVHIQLKFTAYQALDNCAVFYYGSSDGDVGDTQFWQDGVANILARASTPPDLVIGVEDDVATDQQTDLTRLFPGAEFTAISHLLQRCRNIKDRYEISNCQKAADVAKTGINTATTTLQAGSSEIQAVLAAKATMHARWADRYPRDKAMGVGSPKSGGAVSDTFPCHVLTGPNKFLLVAPPTNKVPQNQTVLVCCRATINGYHAAIARTIVVGNAPGLDARMLRHLHEIRPQVLSQIRPGVPFNTVYQQAYDLLQERGYDPPDEIGCLTGLEPHEVGALDATTTLRFAPGMVLELKLSIANSPTAKVQFSDTIVVTEHGCQCLT